MRKLGGRWLGVGLAFIILAAGAAWLAVFLSRQGLDRAAKFSEVAAFILALAAVLLPTAGRVVRWVPAPKLKDEQIDSDAADLAAALRIQARIESSPAGVYLYDRLPMPVRWKALRELALASWLAEGVGSSEQAERLAGTFDEVLEYFRQLPESRLVVLGAAGAGKTVLVTELTRRLLSAWQPDNPVPVVIPAAAWDPRQTTLFDWVAEQLIRINVDLAQRVRDGRRVITRAQALVDRLKVLPILDGLDEVAQTSLPMATVAVNRYGWSQPLVVTCRTHEYLRIIGLEHGTPVARAPVVELLPLELADIKGYLGPDQGGHWAVLYDRLEIEPEGALAKALANPLMLWLTWAVYGGPSRNPVELADRRRFGSVAAVEHHLLAEFVPAVYPNTEKRTTGLGRLLAARPAPLRWLGFLASDTYLHRQAPGTSDRTSLDRFEARDLQSVAWWRFAGAAHRLRFVGAAIRFTLLWAVLWEVSIRLLRYYGSWHAGRYTGPIHFHKMFLSGPLGQAVWPTIRQLILLVPRKTRQPVYTAGAQITHDIFTYPAFVVYGAALLLAIWVFYTTGYQGVLRPSHLQVRPGLPITLLTNCLSNAIVIAGAMWLVLALSHHSHLVVPFFSQRSTWFTIVVISLSLAVPRWPVALDTATDVVGAVNPAESLRQDRWAAVVITSSRYALFAVAVALFSGSTLAFAYVAFAVARTVVALVLGGGSGWASRQYTDACIWLAVTRRMPWRPMRFLADASRRGVFQELGAIFRFRHARVQSQLQDWYEVYRPRPQDLWLKYLRLLDRLDARTGDRATTLAGAQERVDSFRVLATKNLVEFGPDLAAALSFQARFMRELGHRDGELEVLSQLVTTRRRLAEVNVEASPALAEALELFATRLRDARRNDEAIGLVIEAAEVYLQLARAKPDTYSARLEHSLTWLVRITSKLDRPDHATREVNAVMDSYRELVRAEFGRNRAKYLASLAALVELWQSGREDDAVAEINDAVQEYANLPRTGPSSDPAGCAKSIVTLAGMLERLHRREDACRAIAHAVDIYRGLAQIRPATYRPVLAESLRHLATLYQQMGRPEELSALCEAVSVYRDAAAEAGPCGPVGPRPASSLLEAGFSFRSAPPGLSLTELSALALRLWKLGAQSQAMETVAIGDQLAGTAGHPKDPAAVLRRTWFKLPYSAQASALNLPHSERSRRWWDRRSGSEWAERIRAQDLKSLTDAHDTSAFRLLLTGRDQEAQAEAVEAVDCCRQLVAGYRHLADTNPAGYLTNLADSLDLLAIQLCKVGAPEEEAKAATSEAQLIRRRIG
jgi:tetratricopeptide (TPR) repeat protein/predicted ATPase